VPRKVEFIESYVKVGNDYQWNDNHGELIRCGDCKFYNGMDTFCDYEMIVSEEDFCSKAERKEDGK
jgi:hypothetical protein